MWIIEIFVSEDDIFKTMMERRCYFTTEANRAQKIAKISYSLPNDISIPLTDACSQAPEIYFNPGNYRGKQQS